ncbi:putative nucleotidyltransferase [Rhizobium sp. 1399]|nr:nucleotidyltransferase domain-containing protein [Rhizobium sp. 1399]MDR6665127.1 putative nucleotidyltransferase [Rhizobium sp. 1399]
MDTIPTEGFDVALTLTDTLDHLPASKRRELARVLEIIFFEIEQFRSTKQSAKKANGKILKVILYGSYARGDWVEDRLSGYRSDYDILIVVNSESFAQEQELWLSLDERFLREQMPTGSRRRSFRSSIACMTSTTNCRAAGRSLSISPQTARSSTKRMVIPSSSRRP